MNSLMNIREKNKIYHLYVKKHQITGLKYLGYTSAADPHKYRGSGTYWNNHLKAHGAIYDTEILISTDNKEIIAKKGQYYSKLWNIVASDEWANIKPETGEGGGKPPSQNGRRYWNNGVKNTMSTECPGEGWIAGKLLYCNRKELSLRLSRIKTLEMTAEKRQSLRDKSRLNNSTPPNQTGKLVWNNGVKNTMSPECPGEGWSKGWCRKKTARAL